MRVRLAMCVCSLNMSSAFRFPLRQHFVVATYSGSLMMFSCNVKPMFSGGFNLDGWTSARPGLKLYPSFRPLHSWHLHNPVCHPFFLSSILTYNSWHYIHSHIISAHGCQSLHDQHVTAVKTRISSYCPFPALNISVFSQELNFSCGLFPTFRH